MGLTDTPASERTVISFFGCMNAGKSSLVNAVTGQSLSVVSPVKGTTTDPVRKTMELLPIGPVVIIDTPGFDDEGELGDLRVSKAKSVMNQTDIAVLVIDSGTGWQAGDHELLSMIRKRKLPHIVVYSKSDLNAPEQVPASIPEVHESQTDSVSGITEQSASGDAAITIPVSAKTGFHIHELKELLGQIYREDNRSRTLVRDLVHAGDTVVLVCPIDESAPKGRLILPQQLAIRDLLDAGAMAYVTKETELPHTLASLNEPPALVITDSQAFRKVAEIVPEAVPLTSFSILMARYKGFLETALKGAESIRNLKDGDRILMAEGCTHHRQCNDIGTVKIPGWLRKHTGLDLKIETCSGHDFPDDLTPYALVIHCGGCMITEREVRARMRSAVSQGVPFTNYGIVIAAINGILERSTAMLPDEAGYCSRNGTAPADTGSPEQPKSPAPYSVRTDSPNTFLLAEKLIRNHSLTAPEYACLIRERTPALQETLANEAVRLRKSIYGDEVYVRGLIEISNICKNDCLYCGIRRSNKNVRRYRLSPDEIVSCAEEGYRLGFRTFVLQGGEDAFYTDEVLIRLIETLKSRFPDCAVTLSLGERSRISYQKLYNAGADRYLLRHETADRKHYARLHPAEMSFDNRMRCLKDLKEIGYQVGCGFMVGSPYQTSETLAEDLRFIEQFRPDMCGIGPFIPHHDTPFAKAQAGTANLTCFLLSIIRIIHPPVLLPSTTALGTIHPLGREMGIRAGANVVMPNLSPAGVRKQYELYDNKICTGEESAECRDCLSSRMASIGYRVVTSRGDIIK